MINAIDVHNQQVEKYQSCFKNMADNILDGIEQKIKKNEFDMNFIIDGNALLDNYKTIYHEDVRKVFQNPNDYNTLMHPSYYADFDKVLIEHLKQIQQNLIHDAYDYIVKILNNHNWNVWWKNEEQLKTSNHEIKRFEISLSIDNVKDIKPLDKSELLDKTKEIQKYIHDTQIINNSIYSNTFDTMVDVADYFQD